MAQKPVDKQVAHRFAELVGLGLTQHEAAGAVGIGTRTGERLMTKPEIRQVVEQTRTARDGDPAIWALLEATDEAGNPDWQQRLKGGGAGARRPRRRERKQREACFPARVYVFPREERPSAHRAASNAASRSLDDSRPGRPCQNLLPLPLPGSTRTSPTPRSSGRPRAR